jgi:hypothetical protein
MPYFCLLGGIVATLPRGRGAIAATAVLVISALLGSLRMLGEYQKPNLKAAAEQIAEQAPAGAQVVEPWRVGHAPWDLRFDPLQQGLAIYLDSQYPLSHPVTASNWPRGQEVFGVEGGIFPRGGLDVIAQSAGAHLIESTTYSGLLPITVHRYSAVGPPDA